MDLSKVPKTPGRERQASSGVNSRLAFDRKAFVIVYVSFALVAGFTFISHIDLSWAVYPGYTSGIAVLMIAMPALAPYILSGFAAWHMMAKQWQLLPKYRRLRLYLFLLVIGAGTLFSSLLLAGFFGSPLTRLMTIGLFIAETVAYLGAVGFFLSDEWRST